MHTFSSALLTSHKGGCGGQQMRLALRMPRCEELVARTHQARGRGAVPRPTQRRAPLSERGSPCVGTQAPHTLRQRSCAQGMEPVARQLAQQQCWRLANTNCQQLCNHWACQRQ